ncbi:MAG: dTMP kinase [Candidatus Tumulicola sp.]
MNSPPSAPAAGARFFVVEGIEGSGKSTLLAALAEHLRNDGGDALVTREPGGTPVGDAVRAVFLDRSAAISPLTEAFLINAARAQLVSGAIRPALEAGRLVLCDRYVDSTLAYQGYGRGLDLEFLRDLCDAATGGLEPDLTLVVDVPVEVSRARMRSRERAADRLEIEDDPFHERVRRGYLELAKRPLHYVLDGTLPPERVLEGALRALRRLLASRET